MEDVPHLPSMETVPIVFIVALVLTFFAIFVRDDEGYRLLESATTLHGGHHC